MLSPEAGAPFYHVPAEGCAPKNHACPAVTRSEITSTLTRTFPMLSRTPVTQKHVLRAREKCATSVASKNRLLGAVTKSKWQHAVSVLSVLRHERFCRTACIQANGGTLRVAWRITAAQQAAAADRASFAGPELKLLAHCMLSSSRLRHMKRRGRLSARGVSPTQRSS